MQWTRRTLLGSIASASVPLAGCSLRPDSDGGSDGAGGEGGNFEQVQVEDRTLVIELGSVSAERVNVIAPDGSAYSSTSVAQGATRVEFEIGLSYTPGEYRVVATEDKSTVAETTLTIAPDLAITDVGVGANHPERMPDELPFSENQALVEVSNRGNGPGVIEKIVILGEIPNPTTELAQKENEASGIYDDRDGFGELEQLLIPPDDSVVAFTTSDPFLFTGDGVECKSTSQDGKLTIKIATKTGNDRLSEEYSIHYSASENSDQCNMTIESGVN